MQSLRLPDPAGYNRSALLREQVGVLRGPLTALNRGALLLDHAPPQWCLRRAHLSRAHLCLALPVGASDALVGRRGVRTALDIARPAEACLARAALGGLQSESGVFGKEAETERVGGRVGGGAQNGSMTGTSRSSFAV